MDKFEQQLMLYANAGQLAGAQPEGQVESYVIQAMTGLFKLLSHNINLTKIAMQDTETGESFRRKIVNQIALNMQNNQLSGLVSPHIEPELVAESVVASVERLIYRYVISGEKREDELGLQAAHLFLHGILNQS
ncbi:hypothetical protein D3C77_569460 [compost metagenome]